MISTFQTPFRVEIKEDFWHCVDRGGEGGLAKGAGLVIAVRYEKAGWFTAAVTKFLVIVEESGSIFWVESSWCKAMTKAELEA